MHTLTNTKLLSPALGLLILRAAGLRFAVLCMLLRPHQAERGSCDLRGSRLLLAVPCESLTSPTPRLIL